MAEFPRKTIAEWRALAEKELGGKSVDAIAWQTPEGIMVKPTYTAEERSAVIAAALSRPVELGLPFASWTLDRLVAYLGEKGISMKRSRVSEVLLAEGLKWRQEETWFGARVDPDFERKRGHLSTSIPLHPTTVLSSVLTKWGRKPPRAIPADAWSSQPGHGRNGPNRKSTMAAVT